jgi:hypothetical protein
MSSATTRRRRARNPLSMLPTSMEERVVLFNELMADVKDIVRIVGSDTDKLCNC